MMPPDPSLANATVTLYGPSQATAGNLVPGYSKGRSGAPVHDPAPRGVTVRARATKATLASPAENGSIQSVEVYGLCLFTATDPRISTQDPVGVAWDGTDGTVHLQYAQCNSYAKWSGAWGVEVSDVGPEP